MLCEYVFDYFFLNLNLIYRVYDCLSIIFLFGFGLYFNINIIVNNGICVWVSLYYMFFSELWMENMNIF